ncbi:hypothetical protein FA13DRAFT_11453 [Coprinellus micaceus]|uniref:Uncharacterized protein n=1 Tax=Coprinellus micaceus TaxID=71717 RepID=A0A4Y7TZI8_COPMI|nr:hypothetical protein FA13DRAFT_11453 [Coprinellus micaceus]
MPPLIGNGREDPVTFSDWLKGATAKMLCPLWGEVICCLDTFVLLTARVENCADDNANSCRPERKTPGFIRRLRRCTVAAHTARLATPRGVGAVKKKWRGTTRSGIGCAADRSSAHLYQCAVHKELRITLSTSTSRPTPCSPGVESFAGSIHFLSSNSCQILTKRAPLVYATRSRSGQVLSPIQAP